MKSKKTQQAESEELGPDTGLPQTQDEAQDLEYYIKTIEDHKKERDQHYDRLLRKQAEFDNYRKRVLREKDDLRVAAQAAVFKELLPVLDSAEKGLRVLQEEDQAADLATYREGYELLVKGLHKLLERFQVTRVPGVGEAFDPTRHEAVLREESEGVNQDTIAEEFRKGYEIQNRLLRPSQVKVAVPTSVDEGR